MPQTNQTIPAGPAPQAAPTMVPVPTSSLADPTPPADEVTVMFRRWHAFGPTAYQRGQQGGFSPHDADLLVRRGIAIVVHDRRQQHADGPAMVRK